MATAHECVKPFAMIDDNQLASLQLFQRVNLDSVRDLLAGCPVRTYPKGTILITPEQKNDRMYLLLEGKVSIHISHVDNAPITYVHEGESIGEMSAHDGLDPSAVVETETETRVLEIQGDTLFRMIDRSHDVARNLLYLLSSRIRSGNRVMGTSLRLQKTYEHHANVDALTGAYNRRWLDNYLDDLFTLQASETAPGRLAFLMVDVDHFKQFNDRWGHPAGDEALKVVAQALKASTRSSDYVVRYGGEEFTVLLPETAVTDAIKVANKIHSRLDETPILFEGQSLPALTVSIGMAGLLPGDTPAALKQAADRALYQAKQSGRHCTCVAERHANP